MTDELRREVVRIVGGLQPEPEPAPRRHPLAPAPEPEAPTAPAQPPDATEEINAASQLGGAGRDG